VQIETTGETSRAITIELKADSGTRGGAGAS
jgi:hypothetical protein